MKAIAGFKYVLKMSIETDSYIGEKIKDFLSKCPVELIDDINTKEIYACKYRNKHGLWHFESPEAGVVIIRRDVKMKEKVPGDSDLIIRYCDEDLANGMIGDIFPLVTFKETQFVVKNKNGTAYARNLYDLMVRYEGEKNYIACYYSSPENQNQINETKTFHLERLNNHGRSKYPDREI